MATDAWGIDDGWTDTSGTWHPAPESTIEALRAAMSPQGTVLGAAVRRIRDQLPPERDGSGTVAGDVPVGRPVWIVRPGQAEVLQGRCRLLLEDGDDAGEVDRLPPDLPLGIHDLAPLDGGPVTSLIVSPGRCHLPADLRTWGVTMQVPTTRSRSSWGIGDLADVRAMATWVGERGGGALALSPLHASTPVSPVQPSPYYPSSRRWRNPLLLRIEEVPGASGSAEVAELGRLARRHLDDPIVDRDRCWDLQRTALEHLWSRRGGTVDDALDRWRAAQGPAIEGWARFCALAERHGPRWSTWPAELRHPESPAVEREVASVADRVAFHAWLQQLLAEQLDAARVPGVRLVQDLAIGVDPAGADAWHLQDLLATGVNVGAPPDDFAADGQSWGLPPFVPWRLRDAGYRPLADLLRSSLAPGGGLRVDHVMGLARLFWIPDGAAPVDGTYVRYPGRELLEVLALESARAGAIVVGEDLGTVEAGFREELRATGVLSTCVVWFEDVPPEEYPREALAMVTTHDLPTVAGAWTGADDQELARLGRPAPADATAALRQRLDALAGAPPGAPAVDAVVGVHEHLGRSPAALVLATLEDLCGVAERPNVPGTTDERPNWSRSLPLPVEELVADATVGRGIEPLRAARTTD